MCEVKLCFIQSNGADFRIKRGTASFLRAQSNAASSQESYYQILRHAVAWCLRHYATSRKVAGSRLNEVNEFFSIYLILPTALGPKVYSASNREMRIRISRARPVRNDDNLTAICEPTV
jgi:hypothetical protein